MPLTSFWVLPMSRSAGRQRKGPEKGQGVSSPLSLLQACISSSSSVPTFQRHLLHGPMASGLSFDPVHSFLCHSSPWDNIALPLLPCIPFHGSANSSFISLFIWTIWEWSSLPAGTRINTLSYVKYNLSPLFIFNFFSNTYYSLTSIIFCPLLPFLKSKLSFYFDFCIPSFYKNVWYRVSCKYVASKDKSFRGGSASKESVCDAGGLGSIPRLGRSGEGNGNPLQYSSLENPMDRRAWRAPVHGVTKRWTRLSD